MRSSDDRARAPLAIAGALAPVALAALALALALAPAPAVAQAGDPPLVVTLEPFAGRAMPLQQPVLAMATVDASCALATGTPPTVRVAYEVEGPAWATVLVNAGASAAEATLDECRDGRVRLDATLRATASQDAPAFAPGPVRLVAKATNALGRDAVAEAATPIEAAYFPLVDVSAPDTIRRVQPGEEVRFPLLLHNFGNGETLVRFERADPPSPIEAELPPSLTLASRQQGGAATSTEAVVLVRAPTTQEVGTLTLRLTFSSTQDPDAPAAHDLVSLLVDTTPPNDRHLPGELSVPLPPTWPLLAAVLALALRVASGRRHV